MKDHHISSERDYVNPLEVEAEATFLPPPDRYSLIFRNTLAWSGIQKSRFTYH